MAEEYRKAAHVLLQLGRRGAPLSHAPCRLSAIHAIELYLNALLIIKGHERSQIRALQHDLAARTALAIASGLLLRKRTAAHLSAMTGNREYVVTRYGPEMAATISQINRLTATLDEVAAKVAAILKASPRDSAPPSSPRIARSKP
ncbi:hypothetical protein [Rhodopseudomonas palustris]|uniref:hypothetical protein n=1 Tax=Rhodopseudomonas palustris TaxID=1076 RepID=UPI0039F53621